jgi:hypothetical protein
MNIGEPVVVLPDKDGILPKYPEPSDYVYWVRKPDEGQFHGCGTHERFIVDSERFMAKVIARK